MPLSPEKPRAHHGIEGKSAAVVADRYTGPRDIPAAAGRAFYHGYEVAASNDLIAPRFKL